MRIFAPVALFVLLSTPALAAQKVVFEPVRVPSHANAHRSTALQQGKHLEFRITNGRIAESVNAQNADSMRVVSKNVQNMPARALAARSRIGVKAMPINPDGTAQLRGSIVGLGMDVYRFHGHAGDSIRIISAYAPAMQFAIFRPDIGMRFGNHQILPVNGEYELRIVNDRKNAAHSKKRYYYNVRFFLTRPGQTSVMPQQPATEVTTLRPIALQPAASVQRSTMPEHTIPTGLTHYHCRQGALAASFEDKNQQVKLFSRGHYLVLSAISGDPQGHVYYSDGRYMLATLKNIRHIVSLVEYHHGRAQTYAANCTV